ncbi:MAG: PHP domain-containing protein [Leptolyngbya sp. SIO1D8]|nr:PHP domain-containing protein [Leptolyngbya sp. SIO1D8]
MILGSAQLDISARISAEKTLLLQEIFEAVQASSCPGEYNFHMHTLHSDGQLSPKGLVEQAIQLGLKEFAITDHHTVSGYQEAKQFLEDWQWRHPAPIRSGNQRERYNSLPRLWVGVEITALLADIEVHILGYAFNPNHKAMQPYLQGHSPRGKGQLAEKVIRTIQAAGGLAVLAHPCRYRRSPEELIPEAVKHGINGIETYYAYDNPQAWRPCPKRTPPLQQLADKFGLLSTCGTDTHGKTLTRRI